MASKYAEYSQKFLDSKTHPSEKMLDNVKKILDKTSDIFYNTDKTSPLTNERWDATLAKYQKYREYTCGAKVQPKSNQRIVDIGHKYPQLVGTLTKTNNMNDVAKWFHSKKEVIDANTILDICVSLKEDGNSVTGTFNKSGKLELMLTRGKDGEGADVTKGFPNLDLKAFVKRKKIERNFGIKFEVTMNDENFEAVNEIRARDGEKTFVNSRAAVAGILGSSDVDKYVDYLQLVPLRFNYEDRELQRKDEIKLIDDMTNDNFIPLYYKVYKGTKKEILQKITDFYSRVINKVRPDLNRMIDGLVIEIMNPGIIGTLGREGDKNKYDFALKFPYMENTSTVRDIEFYYGKTGRITPVVVFDDVVFNGNNCNHVSIANYKRFKELKLRVGDQIIVQYRNDCLAYIELDPNFDQDEEKKPIKFKGKCPKCSEKLKVNKNKTFVHCVNEDCPGRLPGIILNWFEKLNIKGVKESAIEKIINGKLIREIADLYFITKDQLVNLEGIQSKGATVIMNAINSKKSIFDWEMYGSMSIPGIGRKKCKLIFTEYTEEEIDEWDDETLVKKLIKISGIEKKTAIVFTTYIRTHKTFIKNIKNAIEVKSYKDGLSESTVEPKNIVFTGYRDKIRQEILEGHGHSIKGSVSGKTDMVVTSTLSNMTVKIKKAMELSIPVYDKKEFERKVYPTLIPEDD